MMILDTVESHDISEEPIREELTVIPHRIFINHVDQFHAKHISEYLTDQIFGALKSAGEDLGGEGEGEQVDEEEPEIRPKTLVPGGNKYEIIGTKKHRISKITEDITDTISENDREHFINAILSCGFIIYDISQDPAEIPKALDVLSVIEHELEQIQEVGPKTFAQSERIFVFVLITNIMSWGNTKPIDPEDPDIAFTEADYKKRKPHPNFLDQIACEREVVLKGRKYKNKLKTYVICCGVTYGFEEQDLFFLFRLAWNNEKFLPLMSSGTNFIPFLHVQDLAKIIHSLIELLPKKPQYLLAVEQTPCRFNKVVKALSKNMGRGRIREIPPEEIFLYNNMTQRIFDLYSVNLNMEPSFVTEGLGFEFRNDLNIAENMNKIVAEFRESRNLYPRKILIHGPPASGKTTLAKKIAEFYGVHYVSVKTMIEETLEEMREIVDEEIARKKTKEQITPDENAAEEGGDEAEEDEEADLDDLNEKIRDIEVTMANSENGKLPDEDIIRLMKAFLAKNFSQNQGYVLDGYPKNLIQVNELFGSASEAEGKEEAGGEEEGGEDEESSSTIMPQIVISLDATDDFLCERVMDMPEKDVQGTHYTEEHMLRRVKEYHEVNTTDNTILNFFDEHEVHPVILNIMDDDILAEPTALFDKIRVKIGLPIGFEFTPEELKEIARCQEEATRLKEEGDKIQNELLEQDALENYQTKMEEKIRILEDLQIEEEKLLTAQCEPLRSYLMRFVFPTLTEGLLEIARIKPSDPIDYLAEYLFRCNPEGKMFDPAYTRQGELLENVVEEKGAT